MKKAKHLFEKGIYHVSNHSVARNPMFDDLNMQIYFSDKMEKYLSPICDIIAYNFGQHEFQIVIKMKERQVFEDFYNSRLKENHKSISQVPESTYIFSQAMARLQVSFVKHFNFVHKRSGTLMASRFTRNLVENEEELNFLVDNLNAGKNFHKYSKEWSHSEFENAVAMTSKWIYEEVDARNLNKNGYLNISKYDLGDLFENLPPLRLKDSKSFFKHQINRLFGPSEHYIL